MLNLDPTNIRALHKKGISLRRTQRDEEAIKCYNRILEIDPKDVSTWNSKAYLYATIDRVDMALPLIAKSLELEPDKNPNAFHTKGFIFYKQGKYDEALRYYDKAITIKPDYADAWNSKGLSLFILGKHEEAIKCYDKAIEIDPYDPDKWYTRAKHKAKLGDINNSLGDLKNAIERDKLKYIKQAREEPSFQSIRNDERFKTLVGIVS